MTPERKAFHEALRRFIDRLPDDALVYDIGRTHAHEYREWFSRHRYVSIDRNPKANADYLIDVETYTVDELENGADALVCNGVTESASDPFKLISGCYRLTKDGAVALFGIRLLGYPLSPKHDYTRFTPDGAVRLLESAGFRQITGHIVYSENNIPSYSLLECFK